MWNMIVVDDEPLVRIAFKSMVDWAKLGYYIAGDFANGHDALRYIESNPVDVVVTDLKMPVLDGFELIKNTKEKNSDVFFVILSAHDEFHLVKNAYRMGIEDYILKPEMNESNLTIMFTELRDKIESLTQNRSRSTGSSRPSDSVRDGLLRKIVMSGASDEHQKDIEKLGLRLSKGQSLCVCCITLDSKQAVGRLNGENGQVFVNTTLSIMQGILSEKTIAEIFSNSFDEYVAVIMSSEMAVSYICNRLRESFKRYMNLDISIGFSEWSGKGFGRLHELYVQAKADCDIRSMLGSDSFAEKFNIPAEPQNRNALVHKAMRYINDNYMNEITLEDLAKSLSVSEAHLSRLFVKNMGKSFSKYLMLVRVNKAIEYLRNTDMKIYEIAEKVGYSYAESLTRAFRDITGQSPSKFI